MSAVRHEIVLAVHACHARYVALEIVKRFYFRIRFNLDVDYGNIRFIKRDGWLSNA